MKKIKYEDIDFYDIETVISELEDILSEPKRLTQLTQLLRYASDDSLKKAVNELRKLKDYSKNAG